MNTKQLLSFSVFSLSLLLSSQAFAQLRTLETIGEVVFVGGDNFNLVSHSDILLIRYTYEDTTLPSYSTPTNATYQNPVVYAEVLLFPRGTTDFSTKHAYYQECGRDALIDVFDNFGQEYDAVLNFGTLIATKKLANSDFVGTEWQIIFETAENSQAISTTSLQGPTPDVNAFTAPYPPSQAILFKNKNTNEGYYVLTNMWSAEEIKTPNPLRCGTLSASSSFTYM